MKELSTIEFTLEQAIEEYKKYNEELKYIITTIDNMLLFGGIDEKDYIAFLYLRSFDILYIPITDDLKDMSHSFISDVVYSIFKDNIEEISKLDITNKDSTNYRIMMKMIIDSEFPQSVMLTGLNKIIDFCEKIERVSEFYEDTFIHVSEYEYWHVQCGDDLLDSGKFINSLFEYDSDEKKIEKIREEIKDVELNSIGSNSLYTTLASELYIGDLEKYRSVLQKYVDNKSTKPKLSSSSQRHISINNNTSEPKIEGHKDIEPDYTSPRNNNHTVIRKCIAMYYLLNKASPNIFSEGNIRPLSRFIHFLTGNNEKNIYDNLRNMHIALDTDTDKRKRANVEFVADEFEKINLGEIVEQIKRDLEANNN